MKLTDKINEKVGQDKVLHFLLAAWAMAQFTGHGVWMAILGLLIIAAASVAKEKWLDDTPDWMDVAAAVLGAMAQVLLHLIL